MEEKYEYTPLYYGTPCQVRFYEAASGLYRGGIAIHDYIICGCCGSALDIEELLEDAEAAGIDLQYHELPWIDIKDEIRGDF